MAAVQKRGEGRVLQVDRRESEETELGSIVTIEPGELADVGEERESRV